MLKVTRYITMDGKMFDSERDAEIHARTRYEQQLEHTARRIWRTLRDVPQPATPTVLCGWLDEPKNIEALRDLFAMREDARQLEDDTDA